MPKIRRRKSQPAGAALITDARTSLKRNFDHRRHVYAALQWSRIPLLLLAGAAVTWWENVWLATIFIVISVPLPWIAVVIANGVGEPADKRMQKVYKPAVVREQNRRWEQQQIELAQNSRAQLPSAKRDADSSSSLDDDNVTIIDMPEDGAG